MIELQSFFRRLVYRPIAVLMFVVALLGLSWIAASRIPIELLPKGFGSSTVSVSIPWTGANPSEIEQQVIRPMEEEFRSIVGLKEMNSVASEGRAVINLSFSGDADMNEAYAEVADHIERARLSLPKEADRVSARRWSGDSMPVLWCGVMFDPEDRDEVQGIVADVLIPRLESEDGVASVRVRGLEPRSVRILIDQELSAANRVDIGALFRSLQADNISSPIGDLEEGDSRHIVRIDGRFTSLQDIEEFPIRKGLKIKDVAQVVAVRSLPDDLFRIDGRYSMGMSITKETSANTFEVCKRLTDLMENELPNHPLLGKMEYSVFWSEGESIQSSLEALVKNSLYGGLIACVVLFIFMRRIGYTLLVACSIPFSVLATLAWLYFAGDSFNMMSMMGITISIGMLVDNAVVIVESIIQRRERGESVDDACINGPSEMALAVTTATLTTVVVFLPLIFMADDRMAKTFTHAMGIPLCVALVSALILAELVVPTACRLLSRGPTRKGRALAPSDNPHSFPSSGFRSWMPRLARWSLQNRLKAGSLSLLFLASGSFASSGNSFQEGMLLGGGQISYSFEFAANTSLQEAEESVILLEETLNGPLNEMLGSPTVGIDFNKRGGEINLWHEGKQSPEQKEHIQATLKESLPKRPAYELKIEDRYDRMSQQDKWTRIAIAGPDSTTVADLGEQVREAARASSNWKAVQEDEQASREVLVRLNRDRLQKMGSSSRAVLGSIEYGLRGLMVSRFQTERGEIPVILEFDRPENPDREVLREMTVAGWEKGAPTPLSVFAEFEDRRAPSSIFRRDGKTMAVVGLKHSSDDMRKAANDTKKLMAGIEMPDGFAWEQAGGWSSFQQDMGELKSAFALAVALVFLLMGLLFESLALPFSVLVTIGFAVVGANWAFKLTGTPMDLVAMIGMIVLAGVVVNNGIVLVDRIIRLEKSGLPRSEAVVRGVQDRLRPVLMTAMTTIAGLLPLALSKPDGSGISFQGLAVGVSGGLTFTTFFTLWVVPLLYTVLQDFGAILRAEVFDRLFSR
ncbi:MAG: efflux RND transporter permease subunit [Planctomycetota bacterium]|nr:efflux RND transporter permease subunit [Planctomycetota bacterium]